MFGKDAEAARAKLSDVPIALCAFSRPLWVVPLLAGTHFFNALANTLPLPANVDWALMNFMADWFPVESREKLQSSQHEASAELAQELGFDRSGCFVM